MISLHKYRDASTEIEFTGLEKIILLDKSNRIFLIDKNVYNLYKEYFPDNSIVFEAGEENKTISKAGEIISLLLENKIDKSYVLTGVGGGITTDLSGFAASIYKRGIKCEFIPTSLIAMCDASIGGKNGVNSGGFKNQAGTVRHPAKVYIIPEFLGTLPENEFRGGLAEIVKIFAVSSYEDFEFLENTKISELKTTHVIKAIIEKATGSKYNIVRQDESDSGIRRILNFGHTTGHAFETTAGLNHGHAVSLGMALSLDYSVNYFGLDKDVSDRIKKLLTKFGLPVNYCSYKSDTFFENIRADKKISGELIDFIVLAGIGKAVIKKVNINEFIQSIANLCKHRNQ